MLIALVIQNFLDFSHEAALSFLELLRIEEQWKTQHYAEEDLKLQEIKTQVDLFKFIQAIGQSQWFKGHDRSRYEGIDINRDLKEKYFNLFEKIGLIDEISYNMESGAPNFLVVLGGYERGIEIRVNTLVADCNERGVMPTENIIIGLGCNRKLDPKREPSANRLQDLGEDTEMNVLSSIVEAAIAQRIKTKEAIKYKPINTSSSVVTRVDPSCVKTGDTAASLKDYLESYLEYKNTMDKPIIAVYSNQPFILRQQFDMQSKLGEGYKVYGVGQGITEEEFIESPTIIVSCLAELARIINTKFTEKFKHIKDDLTEEQIQEIHSLSKNNTQLDEIQVPTEVQVNSVERFTGTSIQK
ncbi:hypothetical protein NOX90_03620 [Wolbachia endosymbiont of Anurida maritima]|uniref:hypothetical protein n=1 Tax=Wolbachia endosymbiont of Anurida maritima TaxID=2850562 RepID=UPI0035D13610